MYIFIETNQTIFQR